MVDLLLDSNIIIYLSQNDEKYINFMRKYPNEAFGVSVITYMEVLMGEQDSRISELEEYIEKLMIIDLSQNISFKGIQLLKMRNRMSLRDPILPDIIIAATALYWNIPLVTNNPKDFKIFKDLELIVP